MPRGYWSRWLGGMAELRTDRLVLRRWRDSDLEPWAAMNADPEVREQAAAEVKRYGQLLDNAERLSLGEGESRQFIHDIAREL